MRTLNRSPACVGKLDPARPGATRSKLPPFTHQVLPNGMIINIMKRPGVPLVEFHLAIRGGDESDPAEMAGLTTSLTATLLRTRHEEIEHPISSLSNSMRSVAASQRFQSRPGTPGDNRSTPDFLAKDLSVGLDLIADAVLNPTFPEAEVKKTLSLQRIDAVKSSKGQSCSWQTACISGPFIMVPIIPTATSQPRQH